jgi:hypothetical protein
MAKKRAAASGSEGQATRQTVSSYLSMAQEIADPAAGAGDPAGAFEVYACTLRLLIATVRGAAGLKAEFRKALRAAEALPPAERTAAIRPTVQPFLPGAGAARHVTAGRDRPLRYIRQYIDLAIQIGAPSYNAGDHRGCYEVYSCTARFLLKTVEGADGAKGRLDRALKECPELDDPNQQAWAMRHGFDDVLAGSFGAPANTVRAFLTSAIQIGAPAYDAGDHRGCYDVYACTARLILHTITGSSEAKQVLRGALQECAAENNVSEQAWILRRAFDQLLAGDAV